jgi:hypothetical protein
VNERKDDEGRAKTKKDEEAGGGVRDTGRAMLRRDRRVIGGEWEEDKRGRKIVK